MALRAREFEDIVSRGTWTLPAVLGTFAGVLAWFALQLSVVWLGLVTIGLFVLVVSLVVRSGKAYWLSVFIVTITLPVTKLLFFTPADIEQIQRTLDFYLIENVVPLVYLSDLPLMMLLAILASEVLLGKKQIEIPKVVLLPAAFIVWSLLSLIGARAPLLGYTWILYQIKVLVMFLWFVNASLDRDMLRLTVRVLALGLALQGAISIAAFNFQIGGNVIRTILGTRTTTIIREGPRRQGGGAYVFETGDLLRGTGTVGVANNQAKYYVMLIPLALMCGVMATKTGDRVLFFSAFALGMAGLYYTFSRGGVLCTLFALGLLPLLLAKRGIVNRKHIVMLLVVGCLAAVVSIPFFYDYLTTRPGYFDLRFKHIYYGIMGVLESSFFGMGMNNFTVTVTEHQYEGIFQTMPIHNHYLRIGMETGILGLLLYLSFFVWVAVQAYRSIFVKDMFLSTTSMALLASLLGIMLYWMDDIFYDIVIRTQFWVLVSLIVVIRRLSSKDLSQGMTAIGTN